MVEQVSILLINHHQDILYNTQKKLYKNSLAWWWTINKFATCCSVQQDCYYVTIKLKHNRLSNLKIILVSFINCGWYCDLWGSLWCNEKLQKHMHLRKAWINAPYSNNFTWGHETPFLPNDLLSCNGFTAEILWTAVPLQTPHRAEWFPFIGTLKK